jgi:hypothetical protein
METGMIAPIEMVKRAMLAGHRDSNSSGIEYLRTTEGYSIRPATYGRLRTMILKKDPYFGSPTKQDVKQDNVKQDADVKTEGPKPERGLCPSCEKILTTMEPDLELALAIRELLKRHSAERILSMTTIVACLVYPKKD